MARELLPGNVAEVQAHREPSPGLRHRICMRCLERRICDGRLRQAGRRVTYRRPTDRVLCVVCVDLDDADTLFCSVCLRKDAH